MNNRPAPRPCWPPHEPRGTRCVRVCRSGGRPEYPARRYGGLEALPLSWCKNRNCCPLPVQPRRSRSLPAVLRGEAWAQDLDGGAPVSRPSPRLMLAMAICRRPANGLCETPCGGFDAISVPLPAGRTRCWLTTSRRCSRLTAPRPSPVRRDKAILLVGFCVAFRRSDLVNLDIEDLAKADEGLVLMIRKAKTDQKREGRKIGISLWQRSSDLPCSGALRMDCRSSPMSGAPFSGCHEVWPASADATL